MKDKAKGTQGNSSETKLFQLEDGLFLSTISNLCLFLLIGMREVLVLLLIQGWWKPYTQHIQEQEAC